MEERSPQQPKPSRGTCTLLQVLHLCLTIGLIVAVVFFQLQINSRLEKLESKRLQSEERLPDTKESKANLTAGFKNNLEMVTPNSRPVTKRDLEKQLYLPVNASGLSRNATMTIEEKTKDEKVSEDCLL